MELIWTRTAKDDPQTIRMVVRIMMAATSGEDSTRMATAIRISVILSGCRRAPRSKILRWTTNEC